ncbi:MAG: hypothetical protein R6U88_04075 [Candidatus Bipolaricaulota bacterium]
MDLNVEAQALSKLPQRDEDMWQLAVVQFPPLGDSDAETSEGPLIGLCGSTETGHVRSSEIPEDTEVSPVTLLLEALVGFANDDDVGYRPGKLQVHDERLAEWLGEQLAPAAIQVEALSRLELIERSLEQLMEQLFAPGGSADDQAADDGQGEEPTDHG